MQLKTILCAGMLAAFSMKTGSASASLIIGNGSLNDPTENNGQTFGAHDGYGVFFSMGGTAATAKSASVLMKSSAAITKDFRARVYTESTITNNPTPAPLISSTFTASFSSASTKWFSIDFGSGISLTATQNYIFAIEEVVVQGNTDIAWSQPASPTAYSSDIGAAAPFGTFVQRVDNSNTYATFSGPNFGFQLSTEAVPEPSSLALMTMGLASVAAAARKARKKKAATATATADAGKAAV